MNRNLKRFLMAALAATLLLAGCNAPGTGENVLTGSAAPIVTGNSVEPAGEYDGIFVKYKEGAPVSRNVGGEVMELSTGRYAVVDLAEMPTSRGINSVSAYVAYLNSLPEVEYAEPNYIYHAYGIPNDPNYSAQWHMSQLNMPQAWDLSTGAGVVVAVIDTGVAYRAGSMSGKAPDLAQTNFTNGYDFVNNDYYADDDNSHGTHVAGTIAQSTNNGVGVTGMAYNATIMPIKVLGNDGSGTLDGIVRGIEYAADNGAQVINMSLGSDQPARSMEEACQYAYNRGVVIVCAAGNNGSGSVGYPAAYDQYCIAVGATDYNKQKTGYSQYGYSLDVTAPGGDTQVDLDYDGNPDGVLQQTIGGYDRNTGYTDYSFKYSYYQGTSMASPHAAGLAALILAKYPTLDANGVRNKMQNTAEDLGAPGKDNTYGYGLIDPVAALDGDIPHDDLIAPDAISNLTVTSFTKDSVSLSWSEPYDNVGVTGYYLYKNGAPITVYGTSYTDSGLAKGTYTYTVRAFDAAGNVAVDSNSVTQYVDGNGTNPGTDWATWTNYSIGDVVTWQGVSYTCRIAHMSLPGWEPNVVPALWQRN